MSIQRTPEEQYRFLVGRAAEVMAERIRNEVPPSGHFNPPSVSFPIPETGNYGCLYIEPSLTGTPEQRRLVVAARRAGFDRLISNYLVHDANENILKYLGRENIVDELIPYFKRLSERMDEA